MGWVGLKSWGTVIETAGTADRYARVGQGKNQTEVKQREKHMHNGRRNGGKTGVTWSGRSERGNTEVVGPGWRLKTSRRKKAGGGSTAKSDRKSEVRIPWGRKGKLGA